MWRRLEPREGKNSRSAAALPNAVVYRERPAAARCALPLKAETGCRVGRGGLLAPPTPTAAPAEPIPQVPEATQIGARCAPHPHQPLQASVVVPGPAPATRSSHARGRGLLPRLDAGMSGSGPLPKGHDVFLLDFVSKSLHLVVKVVWLFDCPG